MRTKFPKMFCTWITKHVSGCCGVNSHLNYIDDEVENKCPSCGLRGIKTLNATTGKMRNVGGETTHHISVCPDPDHTKLFQSSVDELVRWMSSHDTDPHLTELIGKYLREQGKYTMFQIAGSHIPSRYNLLIKYHDKLGWTNFIEGRVLTLFVQHQRDYLRDRDRYMTAETWVVGLMEHLIKIVHRQWLYRNATVHYTGKDGRTIKKHDQIMKRISDLLWTDPDDLLDDNAALLNEDFEGLGKSSATNKELWVASMEAALLAADHLKRAKRKHGDMRNDNEVDTQDGTAGTRGNTDPYGHAEDSPEFDNEGSLRYRTRRQK